MNPLLSSRTRRSVLQLSLTAALAMTVQGGWPIRNAAAEKKTKKRSSVQVRNRAQKDLCEIGGGNLEVNNIGGGSWETTCHGGDHDGYACTNTAKSTVCVGPPMQLLETTNQPEAPSNPLVDPGNAPFHPLDPNDLQPLEQTDVLLASHLGGKAGQGRDNAERRWRRKKQEQR